MNDRQVGDRQKSMLPETAPASPTQGMSGAIPLGSRHSSALRSAWRVWKRQGSRTVARKVLVRLIRPLARRYQALFVRNIPWKPDDRPVFLLISHASGGGTQKHVDELRLRLCQENVRPLVIRPEGAQGLCWEERDSRGKLVWCRLTGVSRTEIDYQLGLLRPVHVHIHHMMGHSPVLLDRIKARRLSIDWTIHDYHGICPRIHLHDKNGEYCGEPGEEGCNHCLKTLGSYHGQPFEGDIKTWRGDFVSRVQGARRVFVPSADVARRLNRFIASENLTVRPHFEDLRGSRPVSQFHRRGELVRVAVIGAIVNVKGSERLYACAADARTRKLPLEFHVIGPTDRDRDFLCLGNVRVLGPYRDSDVYDHLERAQCHVALLPSVWPETFMYTLSVAMSAGFWTMCFDLGAQADRLRSWGHGRVLRLSTTPAEINRGLLEAATKLGRSQTQAPASVSEKYPQLLRDYYEFTAFDLKRMGVSSGEERQIPAPHLTPRTQPSGRQQYQGDV